MTLVLGLTDQDGHVWMGADSRASNGQSYFDGNRKLLKQHNYVVGISGSFRVLQIIENNPQVFDPVESDKDMFAWCNALRELLTEHGFSPGAVSDDDPEHNGVWLLLGTDTSLYVVFGNYQYHNRLRWAVGSGAEYGLGYLDATSPELPAKQRLTQAIRHTAGFVPTVSPSSRVVRVGGK